MNELLKESQEIDDIINEIVGILKVPEKDILEKVKKLIKENEQFANKNRG